ncbi:hypothetical protein [Bradyrhizobium jicamae]
MGEEFEDVKAAWREATKLAGDIIKTSTAGFAGQRICARRDR